MMNEKYLWDKVIEFHGHTCGGVMIGFKAALYAAELLGLSTDKEACHISEDEEIVCISENDACGVDAIQVILGCTAGKGNLLFRIRGKQAFNFYNRKTGKSVRLILKDLSQMGRGSYLDKMKDLAPGDCFDITEVHFDLPERARHFASFKCDKCGELTADYLIRLQDDKKLCMDCFKPYDRFSQ